MEKTTSKYFAKNDNSYIKNLDELYTNKQDSILVYPMCSPIFQPYIASNITSPDFKVPTVSNKYAIGSDIYMQKDITIHAESFQIIDSGLKLKQENIPPRHYVQLVTKGSNYSIIIQGSTIEPNFNDEIYYTLHNPYKRPLQLKKGESYVKAITMPYYPPSTTAEVMCQPNFKSLLPWKHYKPSSPTKEEVSIITFISVKYKLL